VPDLLRPDERDRARKSTAVGMREARSTETAVSAPENFVPFMPHGEATAASVQETLQGALELLGPNGENWLQGQLRGFQPNPSGGVTFAFCVVGALEAAAPDYESYAGARDALKATLGSGNIDRFNNGAFWPDVQGVLRQTALRVSA